MSVVTTAAVPTTSVAGNYVHCVEKGSEADKAIKALFVEANTGLIPELAEIVMNYLRGPYTITTTDFKSGNAFWLSKDPKFADLKKPIAALDQSLSDVCGKFLLMKPLQVLRVSYEDALLSTFTVVNWIPRDVSVSLEVDTESAVTSVTIQEIGRSIKTTTEVINGYCLFIVKISNDRKYIFCYLTNNYYLLGGSNDPSFLTFAWAEIGKKQLIRTIEDYPQSAVDFPEQINFEPLIPKKAPVAHTAPATTAVAAPAEPPK